MFSCWFVWNCIPPPSLPLCILVVGAVIVFHVCFFHSSTSMVFITTNAIIIYFSLFWSASTECLSVWLVPMFMLSYFILFIPSLEQELMAGWWILLATGVVPSCRGWVCLPTIGLFWTPDLHLWWMLFITDRVYQGLIYLFSSSLKSSRLLFFFSFSFDFFLISCNVFFLMVYLTWNQHPAQTTSLLWLNQHNLPTALHTWN